MRAVAKLLRARAIEHSFNFGEQFEQRPNFASTLKLNGTIRYPYSFSSYLGSHYSFQFIYITFFMFFCVLRIAKCRSSVDPREQWLSKTPHIDQTYFFVETRFSDDVTCPARVCLALEYVYMTF